MARTVDPEKHEARRLLIIDAALTGFAAHGYAGTSTAQICREAGIGSGTFFHYFPTKQAVLLAILALGVEENREWFAARGHDEDPSAVLDAYLARVVEEMRDPRVSGFVRAVGAVMGEPEIEAALALDAAVVQEGLQPWVARAQESGQIRRDLTARDLTAWILLLVDGFLGRIAVDPEFTAEGQVSTLRDAVRRLVAVSGA